MNEWEKKREKKQFRSNEGIENRQRDLKFSEWMTIVHGRYAIWNFWSERRLCKSKGYTYEFKLIKCT